MYVLVSKFFSLDSSSLRRVELGRVGWVGVELGSRVGWVGVVHMIRALGKGKVGKGGVG